MAVCACGAEYGNALKEKQLKKRSISFLHTSVFLAPGLALATVYKCVRCSSVYTTIEDVRGHVCPIPLEQASASNGPSQLPLGLHIPAAPLHLPPAPAPQKLAPAPLHLPPAPAPLNLSVAGPSPACAPKWAPVSTPQQMHKGSSSDPVGPGPSTSQSSTSQPKPSAEHGKKRRRKSEAP
ncbi:cyclin-dependent kinase inhibitor 1C-like [Sinocyclocheilus grahami]|uniref:cyclin-dependent kinase inhibitor 1C-like n=1 Tax=Sinocyclocheilus grahami TaxID=75366 RepID=UPI0007AD4E12|nr:PREDICTED: cyclin-dependent kinase inhibitor 1C-like [Sinocyclocheilus grahami]